MCIYKGVNFSVKLMICKLVALSDSIQELLTTSTDANEVKELHKKWLKAYDELLFSHESFQDLLKLSSEDGEKDDKEFQERNVRFQKVKDSVEQWFAKHSKQHSPSQVSFDVKSLKSRLSHTSKASSQIFLEKLKEGQRKAELLAKASALDEQRKLEAAKLELKMKEEELKIKTELKISDARTRLLEELERSELHDQQLENFLINENVDRNVTFHLDPMNALASENSTPNIIHRPVQHIVDPALLTTIQDSKPESNSGIQTVARELNKPKADIQKYDGNPMNYTKFWRQFNARICSNTESYEERLNFLLQFTKALNWPLVKQDSAKALDQFAIFLRECQYAVENIDAGRVLEYSENLKLLVKNLPFYLHDKRRNCVYELKEKKLSVKFHHLVDFVRKEAKKATDPIYGREMMSTPSSANKRLQDHKKSETHKNFTVKTDSRSQALPIVPVRVKLKFSDKYVETYAFLDSGSNATFCLENIVRSLKVERK
ncbi:uncharacterized protein LOC133188682 [Saccostrea echinata]|uniref:uncharacterized protein LOC133188682 n=1 Tax=Saccostrea echinata TaxID=191078 RepID=UPI002A801E12|nr:uncharacterized protein LOC133188682 [Saccostrea echinata]